MAGSIQFPNPQGGVRPGVSLGFPSIAKARPLDPFLVVQTANGVTLDFMTSPEPIAEQQYAFLVSEAEFDAVLGRTRQSDMQLWADPMRRRQNQINMSDGGRGVYFLDPSVTRWKS
jgi:hypothetical protein